MVCNIGNSRFRFLERTTFLCIDGIGGGCCAPPCSFSSNVRTAIMFFKEQNTDVTQQLRF